MAKTRKLFAVFFLGAASNTCFAALDGLTTETAIGFLIVAALVLVIVLKLLGKLVATVFSSKHQELSRKNKNTEPFYKNSAILEKKLLVWYGVLALLLVLSLAATEIGLFRAIAGLRYILPAGSRSMLLMLAWLVFLVVKRIWWGSLSTTKGFVRAVLEALILGIAAIWLLSSNGILPLGLFLFAIPFLLLVHRFFFAKAWVAINEK